MQLDSLFGGRSFVITIELFLLKDLVPLFKTATGQRTFYCRMVSLERSLERPWGRGTDKRMYVGFRKTNITSLVYNFKHT